MLPAGERPGRPELIIRCDDVGMSHAGNQAIRRLLETGKPFSASVMIASPWSLEAAAILEHQPQVSIGIHLTLNSEWEHYKWGPILGASAVPSLVDENGYFHATSADFANAEVSLEEVEMELRAQVEKARRLGLRVDYLDYHMLTAISTPELQSTVEELAAEFGLGLSRYFGEPSVSLWDVEPESKQQKLLEVVAGLEPGASTLLVLHLGIDGPEMAALVDVNNPADPDRVGKHRGAELEAILSPAFERALAERDVQLLNYRHLIERHGLDAMRRPAEVGYDTLIDPD